MKAASVNYLVNSFENMPCPPGCQASSNFAATLAAKLPAIRQRRDLRYLKDRREIISNRSKGRVAKKQVGKKKFHPSLPACTEIQNSPRKKIDLPASKHIVTPNFRECGCRSASLAMAAILHFNFCLFHANGFIMCVLRQIVADLPGIIADSGTNRRLLDYFKSCVR